MSQRGVEPAQAGKGGQGGRAVTGPGDRDADAASVSGRPASRGMAIARKVVVSGRVQGVFYRDSCRSVAQRLQVTGWVRNRPDGRVEGHFEGEPDAVDAMVAWCHEGPSGASVTGVTVEHADLEDHSIFHIA